MNSESLMILLIVAIVILIVLSGIFSCSDIVYATVNKLKLKKDIEKKNSSRAKIALKFAENYNETLVTVLFMNNLVNIAATSLATVLAILVFSDTSLGENLGSTLMSFILLISLLIFGEILPKVIGRAFSYRLSKILAYPILVLKYLFFPIVFVLSHIGELLSKPFTHKKKDIKEENITSEELQEMIDVIEEEGVIDEDQGELLNNAIIFKDTEAHEIMTPRVECTFLDIEDDINEEIVKGDILKHSRIPVYQETTDNIIGILSTKVLLRKLLAKEEIDIPSMLDEPHFVPGSMGISEILEEMKETKNHIVIVKDEYGGTDGILTMEDILEELVGEMWDEKDVVHEDYKKIKRTQYIVDGMMNIEDFFELMGVNMPEDADYKTVGGFVVDKLERFAKVNDKIKYENLTITVSEVSEFAVEKVHVKVGRKRKDV